MSTKLNLDAAQIQRLKEDIMDSLDEELENEFEDVGQIEPDQDDN